MSLTYIQLRNLIGDLIYYLIIFFKMKLINRFAPNIFRKKNKPRKLRNNKKL